MRQSDRGRRSLLSGVGMVLAALFAGCAGCQSRLPASNDDLGRVAKHWSLVMRANQLTPLYPPSNSVQPGTVLLSQSTVFQQLQQLSEPGFLEVDLEFGQITPRSAGDAQLEEHVVAFPSFWFETNHENSINIGLPIQSLAVAAGFVDIQNARIDVKLDDASTRCMPAGTILESLDAWQKQHSEVLGRLGRRKEQTFIRVVSQIFLAKSVTVTIRATHNADANVNVDATSVLKKDEEATLGNSTLKLVHQSGNAIVLSETFSKPVVLGYRGIDFAVLANGSLGPPVIFSNDDLRSQRRADLFELLGLLHYVDAMPDADRDAVIDMVVRNLSWSAQAIYNSPGRPNTELALTFQKWLRPALGDGMKLQSEHVARLFVACYAFMAGERYVYATSEEAATVTIAQFPPEPFRVRAVYVNSLVDNAIETIERKNGPAKLEDFDTNSKKD